MLVVVLELMKMTDSDDDDDEWNNAQTGLGRGSSSGGLITPNSNGGLNFDETVGVSISSKRFPEANFKT